MKNRFAIPCCLTGALLLNEGEAAFAQTNSWTNSASGQWEDAYWSLGVLPGTNQAILFTNAGSKTLAIGPDTAQTFPETLTVDSIAVLSPTNSSNTLLLSNAGFQTPLTANYVSVGSDSAVVMQGSALHGAGLSVGGAFTQDGSSEVTNQFIEVGDIGPGTYSLNSGTLITGSATIGRSFPSFFVQQGGTNSGYVRIFTNSGFDLNGGELNGTIWIRNGATFKQQGGTFNNSGNTVVDGYFFQSGGILTGLSYQGMCLPGYTFFPYGEWGSSGMAVQTGGTNEQSALVLGIQTAPNGDASDGSCNHVPKGSGVYTLSGGALITSGMLIWGNGSMEQSGGTHTINGSMSLQGAVYYFNEHHTTNVYLRCLTLATYRLSAGMLSARDVNTGVAGGVAQYGGTNEVTGTLTLNPGSNSTAAAYGYSGGYGLGGGVLIVSNISVSGRARLSQSGGQLIAGNIAFSDSTFYQSGGNMTQSGTLTLSSSSWEVAAGDQQAGQLQVAASSLPNSSLSLPSDPCTLRFADSSSLGWSSNVVLAIYNWSGSRYGGGRQRIIFGSNNAGLTAQQLSRVQFNNPVGLPAGTYPPRILGTGEVVPDLGTSLPPIVGLSIGQSNGVRQVRVEGDIGQTYTIQCSTDLLHWLAWTSRFNANGTISVNDTEATNYPQRFYRASLMP
jgi:hypothetical protein